MQNSDVTAWLEAAGRYPLLKPAQEIELGRRIQAARGLPSQGCTPEEEQLKRRAMAARKKLLQANLRLVAHVVGRSFWRSCPAHMRADYLQAGAMGAWRATETFDPSLGYKFSTYCTNWIYFYCQQEFDRTDRVIRPPSTVAPAIRRLYKASRDLYSELGRDPTIKELSKRLRISEDELRLALRDRERPLSLDAMDSSVLEMAAMDYDSDEDWDGTEISDTVEETNPGASEGRDSDGEST